MTGGVLARWLALMFALVLAVAAGGSAWAASASAGDCSCAWFQVWGLGGDNATALALHPGLGETGLYVTGFTDVQSFATIRYDGPTGMPAWISRFGGAAFGTPYMQATAIAVAPVGNRVFVTGIRQRNLSGAFDYATLAYDASSGVLLWQRYVIGPVGGPFGENRPTAIVASPDGSMVFVTGSSTDPSGNTDLLTIAYSASTGKQLWASRWAGGSPGNRSVSILANPDGSAVYVTGPQTRPGDGTDYLTIAYGASDGKPLWVQRFDDAEHGNDSPSASVLSSDGSRLYVTGTSLRPDGTGQHYDAATLAYDTHLGTRLWLRRYAGTANAGAGANAIDVTPDGSRIFITGWNGPQFAGSNFATVAYTAGGNQAWARSYDTPPSGYGSRAVGLAVAPDGSVIYVTGNSYDDTTSWDIATLAYDAASGNQVWVKRFDDMDNSDIAAAIGVSPDGRWLFVAGHTGVPAPSIFDQSFLTVAYSIP